MSRILYGSAGGQNCLLIRAAFKPSYISLEFFSMAASMIHGVLLLCLASALMMVFCFLICVKVSEIDNEPREVSMGK